jgi:hypothetical protein
MAMMHSMTLLLSQSLPEFLPKSSFLCISVCHCVSLSEYLSQSLSVTAPFTSMVMVTKDYRISRECMYQGIRGVSRE